MKTSLSFLIVASAFACGSIEDPPSSGERPGPTAQGGADDQPKPTGHCGSISTDLVEVFRGSGSNTFNVTRIATDGTHAYLTGHMPLLGDAPVVDPQNPMQTATLLRAPVSGGAFEIIEWEHGPSGTRAVAVDADNIYWGAEDEDSAIFMRAKKGGPVTSFGRGFGTGAGTAHGIAVDGSGNVFWLQAYHGIGVRRAGTASVETFQEATGHGATQQITADDRNVYWIANRTELRSAPVSGASGGAWTTLASGLESITSFVADDTHVWGVSVHEVWKVPKVGGERVVVATPKPGRDLRSLAVTDDAIYFSDDMEPSPKGGKIVDGPIYKANKDGTDAKAITSDLHGSEFLVADACRVYWRSFGTTPSGGYETVVYSRAR